MSKFAMTLLGSLLVAIAIVSLGMIWQYKNLEREMIRVQQLRCAFQVQLEQQEQELEDTLEPDEEEACFTPETSAEKQEEKMQLSIQARQIVEPTIVTDFAFMSEDEEEQLRALKEEYKKIKPKAQAVKEVSHKKKSVKKMREVITHASDFSFEWPLERHEFWLSSLFGWRRIRGQVKFHYGIDMAAVKGTKVKAAASGRVIQAGYAPGFGNTVLLEHNGVYRTRYAHLYSIAVKQGQQVSSGQYIGKVGDTGHTLSSKRGSGRDASHLHFEVYKQGTRVNPLRYLSD